MIYSKEELLAWMRSGLISPAQVEKWSGIDRSTIKEIRRGNATISMKHQAKLSMAMTYYLTLPRKEREFLARYSGPRKTNNNRYKAFNTRTIKKYGTLFEKYCFVELIPEEDKILNVGKIEYQLRKAMIEKLNSYRNPRRPLMLDCLEVREWDKTLEEVRMEQ